MCLLPPAMGLVHGEASCRPIATVHLPLFSGFSQDCRRSTGKLADDIVLPLNVT
jgi:hypothetical protein